MFSPTLQSVVFAATLLGAAMPGDCVLDESGIRDGVHAKAYPPPIDWHGPHPETMTTATLDHSLEASP